MNEMLRQAEPEESAELAELYGAARAAAVPRMPPAVHTADEDLVWFAERLRDGEHEAWLAQRSDGLILGYALFTSTWLNHLFVRPGHFGARIGTDLLHLTQTLRPEGLQLWVFQTNHDAIRFYQRHGFTEVERTDGAENEELAPDIRMQWPGGPCRCSPS